MVAIEIKGAGVSFYRDPEWEPPCLARTEMHSTSYMLYRKTNYLYECIGEVESFCFHSSYSTFDKWDARLWLLPFGIGELIQTTQRSLNKLQHCRRSAVLEALKSVGFTPDFSSDAEEPDKLIPVELRYFAAAARAVGWDCPLYTIPDGVDTTQASKEQQA